MRADSNKIALRAIRNVLTGAKPFEIDIGSQKVTCSITSLAQESWPSDAGGLVEAEDGPWPVGVAVECRWVEGSCRLLVEAWRWTSGQYIHDPCIRVRTRNREVNFVNVANELEDAEDGAWVKLGVRFFITKPKTHVSDEIAELLNAGMRETLANSQIPILGPNTAELCAVEVPKGTLQPSPEQVFRRLVHLALLKLDFIDRGRTTERGKPLIDLSQWLTASQIQAAGPGEDESVDLPGTERRYWGGGIAEQSRLESFKTGNHWQIFFKRTSEKPAAKKAWKLFARIKPGDWLAIKGLGGKHDLAVHYVGEVVSIDDEQGKVRLKPLPVPLYKGKGPTGPGAGNWQNTLVPITRPDIVQMIFGAGADVATGSVAPAAQAQWDDLPLNLIVYGPPGTGKTHHLTNDLIKRFQREPTKADLIAEIAEELPWYQATAIALHDAGGKAKVLALQQHALIRAKYATSPMKAPLRQRLWATLQSHSVESSKTVKYKSRGGEQLFDKQEDSTWFLAVDLPDELREIAKQLKAPSAGTLDDFTFVTFHQAYGYEDFIEGIRPRIEVATSEEDGQIAYSLEPGAFMKAANAALRLAGYEGSLHDFCTTLTPEQREAQFLNARRYAVFIDEINRGNVARIFGELITLLEDDKRLGGDNEVIVTLPYSKKRFGVPPNLHVIGTMNTADRSIEALDTALRRRFDFRERPPQAELLDFDFEGDIELDEMLRAINRRLERLYDRDHCIGHAYFYSLRDRPTLDALKHVFRNKLIPLLQEYFYGDWGKIGLVLGKDFVRRRDAGGKPFADFEHDDHDALAERATWELYDIDKLSNVAFQRIYKNASDA
ncbi:MAG: AAA family ATPase [Deltaproteobacteria bacterium]|nr:AAA family ATPase [Deltaproteobacteria bacterium]